MMVISHDDALKELDNIRTDLDKINKKSFRFYQGGNKRKKIEKLIETLDIVLQSADPEYKKREIIDNAPPSTSYYLSGAEQEIPATAKKWSQYLSDQLDLYKKRLELLEKSSPVTKTKSENSKASKIIEHVGTYIEYNKVVNITTIIQNIDYVISELDKETNLDSNTKEEIKSKLQKAKDFIKNAGDEAAPFAGKFAGQALRSFLLGNEE